MEVICLRLGSHFKEEQDEKLRLHAVVLARAENKELCVTQRILCMDCELTGRLYPIPTYMTLCVFMLYYLQLLQLFIRTVTR